MATTRTNKVEVVIEATDEASPKIDRLEKKIDGLESDEARIIVTAQTDRLQQQLDTARAKLEQLDGDEASVQARLIGNLETELEQSRRLFEQLDGKTGTVRLRADTADAERELGGLSSKLDDLTSSLGGVSGSLGALAGTAGAVGGVGAGLVAAATAATQIGVEVGQIATVLETSTEEASRLRAVFGDAGVEASDLADIALQVAGAFASSPELVERLGLKLRDVRTPAEALKTAVDSWDLLGATERATLFGEEGVRQVGRIIASGQELDDLLADVEQRRILSEEDVRRSQEMAEMVARLKGHVEGLALAVGGPLVQAVTDLDNSIRRIPGFDEGLFGELATGIADALSPGSHASNETKKAFGILGSEAGDAYIRAIIERVGETEPATQRAADLIAALTAQQERYIETLTGRAGEAAAEREVVEATEAHYQALYDVNREHERVDRANAIEDEKWKVAALTEEWERLYGVVSGELSLLRLQEGLARAQEQLEAGNLSWREARILILEQQIAVQDYLRDLEGIDERQVTQIVAEIDAQQFDRVSAQLGSLATPVTVPVKISVDDAIPGIIRGLLSGTTPLPGNVGGLVQPNVTVINPAGSPAQVIGAENIYYTRNGVRTGP